MSTTEGNDNKSNGNVAQNQNQDQDLNQNLNQGQSQGNQSQSQGQKKRIRAAIACTNCRIQRSKCDGLPLGPACSKCKRSGIPCDMPDEPKRQRFPYRAQVEMLNDRVKSLEELILQSQQQMQQFLSNGAASVSQQKQQVALSTSATSQKVPLGIPQKQQQRKDESPPSDSSSPRVVNTFPTTTSMGILEPEAAPLDQHPTGIWTMYPPHVSQSENIPPTDPFEPLARVWSDGQDTSHSPSYSGGTTHSSPAMLVVSNSPRPIPIQQSQRRPSKPMRVNSLTSNATNDGSRSFIRPRLLYSPSSTATKKRRLHHNPALAHSNARLDLTQIPQEEIYHLLTLYFRRYQFFLKLIPEAAFYRDLAAGQGQYYSPSLFCAMLASGLCYSDKAGPFLLPNGRGDVFSQRSKELLEIELRHADTRMVLTLLLLGELETSRGNDMTAYSYVTLAQRLVFDLRLDLNGDEKKLSDIEVEMRYWLVWFASVLDQYWALTLNKPLTIKTHVLRLSRLAVRLANNDIFAESSSSYPQTLDFDQQVNESMFDLLQFAREVTDSVVSWTELRATGEAYPAMVRLNNQLDQWYASLLPEMRQSPVLSGESSHLFSVLHIHYHATKICLHRPFTAAPTPSATSSIFILHPNRAVSSVFGASEASKSRTICLTSGIEISKIFDAFRKIHDMRGIQTTGTQWATWATEALIGYLAFIQAADYREAQFSVEEKGDVSIDEVVMNLQSIIRTLKEMARWYKTAEQEMDRAEKFLEQFITWRPGRERNGEGAHGLNAEDGEYIRDLDIDDLGGLDACNGEYDYNFEGIEIIRERQLPPAQQQHQQQQTIRPEFLRQQSNTGSLLEKRSADYSDKQDWYMNIEPELAGYQGASGVIPSEQGFAASWAGLFGFDNYSRNH